VTAQTKEHVVLIIGDADRWKTTRAGERRTS
jgi:hypothetical protein